MNAKAIIALTCIAAIAAGAYKLYQSKKKGQPLPSNNDIEDNRKDALALRQRFVTILYGNIERESKFEPVWAGSTGYYEHACSLVDIAPGEIARSFDPFTNRHLVLIGTDVGTYVVFERYTFQDSAAKGLYCLTSNPPAGFKDPFLSASEDKSKIDLLEEYISQNVTLKK